MHQVVMLGTAMRDARSLASTNKTRITNQTWSLLVLQQRPRSRNFEVIHVAKVLRSCIDTTSMDMGWLRALPVETDRRRPSCIVHYLDSGNILAALDHRAMEMIPMSYACIFHSWGGLGPARKSKP